MNFTSTFFVLAAVVLAVTDAYWSTYYEEDNPSGTGDYEMIGNQLPQQVCACSSLRPTVVEVDRRIGFTWRTVLRTDRQVVLGPNFGLRCLNAEQPYGLSCKDYRVRFYSTTSPNWFGYYDRDNVSGTGDHETVPNSPIPSHLSTSGRKLYVSTLPWNTNSRTVSPVTERITAGPAYGFSCVNSQQRSGLTCSEYRVRFWCEPA